MDSHDDYDQSKSYKMAKHSSELVRSETMGEGIAISPNHNHLLRRLNNRQIQLIAIGKGSSFLYMYREEN